MKRILKTILLSKDLDIDLSKDELDKVLSESEESDFRIRKIGGKKYKFLANFSLGTAIVKGGAGLIDGISIYGKIIDRPNSGTLIHFETELRIELIAIFIFWVVLSFFQILGLVIPLWINLILFPMVLLWFGCIYRLQEKSLLKKVEKRLMRLQQLKEPHLES